MSATMSKTKALELLAVALREQRQLYTYRFVLDDVSRHLEENEKGGIDQEETLRRIRLALNVYRYEMKGEQ